MQQSPEEIEANIKNREWRSGLRSSAYTLADVQHCSAAQGKNVMEISHRASSPA